jgi:putative oxidoreductase
MLRRITATSATWATVPLRLALGAAFIGHGAQKVLGSFGGPGFAKFTSFPAPFPFMRPAAAWMGAAAVAELLGGISILLGLFTRLGAFLIVCVMLTAIFGVLLPKGFFAPEGMELAIAYLGMALALLILGGGQASVDRLIADDNLERGGRAKRRHRFGSDAPG